MRRPASAAGIWGGLFGSLVGLLVLNPLAGFAMGTMAGTGTGTLSGRLTDYGIDDGFIKSIAQTLLRLTISAGRSTPTLPGAAERLLMKRKLNSYGKTWYVWNTGRPRPLSSGVSGEGERGLEIHRPRP